MSKLYNGILSDSIHNLPETWLDKLFFASEEKEEEEVEEELNLD